jgi:hypothetical protein
MTPLRVTEVLTLSGLRGPMWGSEEDKEWWLNRGSQIHRATHILDTDEHGLVWSTVDERIVPYVKAYEKFRRECPATFVASEVEVNGVGYVGHLDRVFRNLNCIPGEHVLDIKTNHADDATAIQTAAYAWAWKGRSKKVPRRWAVELKDDGKYKLIAYDVDMRRDYMVFCHALAVAQWQVAHGLCKRKEIVE